MNNFATRSLLAVVCASAAAAAGFAQTPTQPPPVTVTVQPAASVDVVLYSAANTGTVLGRTDAGGKATLDFLKIANAGKIGKVTVTEERCPDQTRLLLTSADGKLPDAQKDCRRRRAGAFIVGQDTTFTAKLTNGGISTTTKAEIIGGAAAAGIIVAAKSGGGGSNPTSPPTPTPGIDLTPEFGTFNISATKVTDTGCSFSPSFTGQLQISGNKDGSGLTIRMIERLTRVYTGTMQSNYSYVVAGTGNLDGFGYAGTITGQVGSGGTTVQGTETLTFNSGCPGRVVAYQFSGSR